MSRIRIPAHLLPDPSTLPETGNYLVDVKLRDGRVFSGLVVKEGAFITGRRSDPSCEGHLPFIGEDLGALRAHSDMLGSLLSFWIA